MKYLLKGIGLGFSLVLSEKIMSLWLYSVYGDIIIWETPNEIKTMIISAVLFFFVTWGFLVSEKISGALICGFSGLFFMFSAEIAYQINSGFGAFDASGPASLFFLIYGGGFFGSAAAVPLSLIMSAKGIKIRSIIKKGRNDNMEISLSNNKKTKYLLYALLSAAAFSYLVLPENTGIGALVFVIAQAVMLFFISPDKKRLFMLVPIGIMALNAFISANHIWRTSNLIISVILFSCMYADISPKKRGAAYFKDIFSHIVMPLGYMELPFGWAMEINSKKAPYIKRAAAGLLIAVPFAALLTVILSQADMVFSLRVNGIWSDIIKFIRINTLAKMTAGIFAGLYLFGILFSLNAEKKEKTIFLSPRLDSVMTVIFLIVILIIYTLFVVIQFKYLFCGATLPGGLTYPEYARKGFFELLLLTGVDLGIIIGVVNCVKTSSEKVKKLLKLLCLYLLAVTAVLLVSSFSRMFLYTGYDGLTRLRLFVLGFLVFESAGLIITAFYIIKPSFNISAVYLMIALCYYLVLNIVPSDRIIAKNQIDKYLSGEREDIAYVYTLSADAAPELGRLWEITEDKQVKRKTEGFLFKNTYSSVPQRWQRYNLSYSRAKKIYDSIQMQRSR